jgi:hypothetical protein
MKYTKAIFLISGEVITITDKEFNAIVRIVEKKPEGFLKVQGQLINKRSIAKIGNHHATSDMKKWNDGNMDRALIAGGREDLVEMKRKLIKETAMNENAKGKDFEKRLIAGDPEAIRTYNAMPDEPKKLMSADESAEGDAEYYVDGAGVLKLKHYE